MQRAGGSSRDGAAGCHGHREVGRVAHARGGLRRAAGTQGSGARVSRVGFILFGHT